MLPAPPALVPIGAFDSPTYLTAPAGDARRLYVTEKPGRLRVVVDGVVAPDPVLDLTALVESAAPERGLLSVAFKDGRTYVYFTAKASAAVSGTAGEIQIREYPGGRILLAAAHAQATNHNGGQLQIGPDGKLWAGTGDGGGRGDELHHAQDPASPLGKLLRFDPVAPGPPEVLARGLRNPWRFSFDRATAQLVLADVGQDQREEVDVGLAANYGWPCREGSLPYLTDPGCDGVATAAPVLERAHPGVCSITGGYVVRDPGLPSLLGRYVYGDFCAPELRSADLANPASDAPLGVSVPSLSSFGEDACGRVYVVSLAGPVARLQEGAATPCAVPPAVPPTPPGAAPRSRRAAVVRVRVTGLRSVARRHRVLVTLRADEPVRATVSARGFRAATAAAAPGHPAVVRLRTTTRRRPGPLRVRVQAMDADGDVTTVTRRVRIRR